MKKPQRALGLVAAAGTALALGACSGGSAGSGASSAPTADEGARKNITLTLTDTMSETSQKIYVPIYEACAEEVGVEIEPNHVAGSGLIATVLQQVSSRTLPDLLMLDNPDVKQIAETGALAAFEDLGISTDGFAPGVVAAGELDGKHYGLGPVSNAVGLIYNVDLLEAAGVEVPTTWDELAAAAAALTEGDRYGLAFSAVASFEGTSQFLPFMWSNGGSEDDLTGAETVEALQFLTDLVQSGSVSASVVNWSQNDVNDQFTAGNAAMMVNGPWNLPKLEASGVNYDVAMLPVPNAGDELVASLGGEQYVIPLNEDAERMQAAAEFLTCVLQDENQVTMATGRGGVPSRLSAVDAAVEASPMVAAFADTVATARARSALLGTEWPTAATKIYNAEQLALTGSASPADALAQADKG